MISLLTTQCQLLKKQKVDFNIMSIDLIRKNTSSPFHLERSIVPQSEDGAYQRGGFNPDIVYNNDAANAAIESFSKSMGDIISNRDFNKKKKEEVKKPTPPDQTAEKEAKVKKILDNTFDPLGINKIDPSKWRR
jgi:hypothetical protein